MSYDKKFIILPLVLIVIIISGCDSARLGEAMIPEETPTVLENFPEIISVDIDRQEFPNYESVELVVNIDAEYNNPYDAREARLEGSFLAPDGSSMNVPGFWDGEEAWKVRFTPWLEGEWRYALNVIDKNGTSLPVEGTFNVTDSDLHGWLQVGNWVDPTFSSQYLVHHDGTPFYGVGHCDALNILTDGFDIDEGVRLFNHMVDAGENYVVWWPLYSNSPVNGNFDDYIVSNLNLIDMVVTDAQKKGIFLIFTIWDHPQLRDESHAWGDGRWDGYNGFSRLTEIEDFFGSEESWVWQENFYRYVIARWGFSPAIGMWQTVSEINGTNAYDQTDVWHERVNAYFVENDPYRHPTTASMSGDVDWPEGHQVMDIPQVHVYSMDHDAVKDPVKAAETIAYWTELMWQTGKPNWIGEFGVTGNAQYPELFHNSIWAALSAGAALTPAEWNSGGAWMKMTPEMYADQGRLRQFVSGIPLAWLDPIPLGIESDQPDIRGWGMAGENGGLFWVQDFSMQGRGIEDMRSFARLRSDVAVQISGLEGGTYLITPYDTWQGIFLAAFDLTCVDGEICEIALPTLENDMAYKIERQ